DSFIEAAIFEEKLTDENNPIPGLLTKRQIAVMSPRLGILNNILFAILFKVRVSIFQRFIAIRVQGHGRPTRAVCSERTDEDCGKARERCSSAQDGFVWAGRDWYRWRGVFKELIIFVKKSLTLTTGSQVALSWSGLSLTIWQRIVKVGTGSLDGFWEANIRGDSGYTNYGGVYDESHAAKLLFWKVVEKFDQEQKRALLRFVTSCSRPQLLRFGELIPNFTILLSPYLAEPLRAQQNPLAATSHASQQVASQQAAAGRPPVSLGVGLSWRTRRRRVPLFSLLPTSQAVVGAFSYDLDVHSVPPEYKREGTIPRSRGCWMSSWCTTRCTRTLFVTSGSLRMTIGCNRTPQIYNTKMGAKTCVLTDKSAGKSGEWTSQRRRSSASSTDTNKRLIH
ncbi:hypothetical protein AX14_009577, partial [Amanita brunnescens Koide BX004]